MTDNFNHLGHHVGPQSHDLQVEDADLLKVLDRLSTSYKLNRDEDENKEG